MTAKMTRNILLMLVATVLMGIVLNLYIHNTGTVPAADNAAPLTPELGGKAAETLAAQLTQTGSTAGADAITGATLTSEAIFTAMDACLAQAQ